MINASRAAAAPCATPTALLLLAVGARGRRIHQRTGQRGSTCCGGGRLGRGLGRWLGRGLGLQGAGAGGVGIWCSRALPSGGPAWLGALPPPLLESTAPWPLHSRRARRSSPPRRSTRPQSRPHRTGPPCGTWPVAELQARRLWRCAERRRWADPLPAGPQQSLANWAVLHRRWERAGGACRSRSSVAERGWRTSVLAGAAGLPALWLRPLGRHQSTMQRRPDQGSCQSASEQAGRWGAQTAVQSAGQCPGRYQNCADAPMVHSPLHAAPLAATGRRERRASVLTSTEKLLPSFELPACLPLMAPTRASP